MSRAIPTEAAIPRLDSPLKPNETVYFIKGGKVRIYEGDESMEAEIPDGHVMYHEAWTHVVENVGDTDILAIIYEPHT